MNYPTEILPDPNYKLIVCDLSKHYLIRYTESGERDAIFNSSIQQIKQDAICSPRERMNDLSTSLLGIYEPRHISFELINDGKKTYGGYCNPDEEVIPPIFNEHFTINNNRGFWVVLIEKIQGIIADYTKPNVDEKFSATCIVMHTPTRGNFWHFSLRWILEDGRFWHELPDYGGKKLRQRLGSETRALIAKFAEVNEPNYYQLSEVEFCKNSD